MKKDWKYEEFFDGWWNNVKVLGRYKRLIWSMFPREVCGKCNFCSVILMLKVFCRQKENEWKKMENMKNFFDGRWYNVHVIFLANMNLHEDQLPCQGNHPLHKYVCRTWIQDVMIQKRQTIIPVTWSFIRYTTDKSRKDVCFSPRYYCREISGLERNAKQTLLLSSRWKKVKLSDALKYFTYSY